MSSTFDAQSYQVFALEAEDFDDARSLLWKRLLTPCRRVVWYDESIVSQAIWTSEIHVEPRSSWDYIQGIYLQKAESKLRSLKPNDLWYGLVRIFSLILANQSPDAVLSAYLSNEELLPKVKARYRLVEWALHDYCDEGELANIISDALNWGDVDTVCLYTEYAAFKHFRDKDWRKSLGFISNRFSYDSTDMQWVYLKLMQDACNRQLNEPSQLPPEFFHYAEQVVGLSPTLLELLGCSKSEDLL